MRGGIGSEKNLNVSVFFQLAMCLRRLRSSETITLSELDAETQE